MRRAIVVLLCILLAVPAGAAQQPVPAQNPEAGRRTRIGLALSGGSALGFAHIGVFKWMEEHRIPIDYVAGTSMGGLIGGLYASGLDAAEIESFVSSVRWQEVFDVGLKFRHLGFRRKEDLRFYPNRLELGLRGGVQAPPGLNPGHGVGLLISRAAAPYSGMESFNELPTPFRCVATDLVTGKEFVFEKGDLFDAMRSTMSIPAFFNPLRVGDKVFVDGGTLNNIPVDVVQKMGADLVIAVELNDVEQPPYAPGSAFDVLGRSMSVMIIANEMRSLRMANLVLSPNLKELGSADFPKVAEFIRRGYAAAARQEKLLMPLALNEQQWNDYVAARRSKRRAGQITPQFVKVEGAVPGSEASLEKRLAPLQGQSTDPAHLDESLSNIVGLGRYSTADYRFVRSAPGDGLLVKVRQKPYGPPVLNLVLDVDGSDVKNALFGIGGRITFMDLGSPGSDLRTDLNLGFRNLARTEYYYRIRGTPLFVAPSVFVDYQRFNVFSGNQQIADFRRGQLGGGLDIGIAAGRFNEIRAGVEASHTTVEQNIGSSDFTSVRGPYYRFHGAWRFVDVDDPIIPVHGVSFTTEAQWVWNAPLADKNHPVFEARLFLAKQVSRRNFLHFTMSGGTTAGKNAGVFGFSLGGPLRLTALARNQLQGNDYYHGGVNYLYSLSESELSFFGKPYLVAGYELGNAFNDIRDANPFNDGFVGVAMTTPVGGVLFGGSYGEQGRRRFFFRLGRLF